MLVFAAYLCSHSALSNAVPELTNSSPIPSNAAPALLQNEVDFDISPQALDTALVEISRQAKISLGVAADEEGAKLAPSIIGRMTIAQALGLALQNTNLTFTVVGSVIAINKGRIWRGYTQPSTPYTTQKENPLTNRRAEEEVIVSIERKNVSLQRYAGTAASLDANELSLRGIDSIESLDTIVPGLHLGTQDGNIEVYIRGVGSNNNTETGDPAAATHLDGVYIPRPAGLATLFHDLERVEVSIGPQGTIRGRNATAGSINVVTHKPDLKLLNSELILEAGSYGKNSQSGFINIPIYENAAVRFSAKSSKRDSYFENKGLIDSVDMPGRRDAEGIRGQILYESQQHFSALYSADYNLEKGSGYATSRFASTIDSSSIGDDYESGKGQHPVETLDPYKIVWASTISPKENTTNNGQRIEFRYRVLPSLSSEFYLSSRNLQNYVSTLLAANVYSKSLDLDHPLFFDKNDRFVWDRRSDSKNIELRFIGEYNHFYWSAGIFGFRENQATLLASTADKSEYFWGQEFNTRTDISSLAGYFDATVDLSDTISLTYGARRTEEKKQRRGGAYRLDFPGGDLFNKCNGVTGIPCRYGSPGWSLIHGLDRDLGGDGADFSNKELLELWTAGVHFSPLDTLSDLVDEAKGLSPEEDNSVTPTYVDQSGNAEYSFNDFRTRLTWEPSIDHLFYASVSSGHKSGGFNDKLAPDSEEEQIDDEEEFDNAVLIYAPEKLIAYELGAKNVFSDFTINASAFFYDYKNQQLSSLTSRENLARAIDTNDEGFTSPSGGDILYTFNIPQSEVLGFQIEGKTILPADIEVAFNILYLDAKVTSNAQAIDNRVEAGSTLNIKDKKLPKAPELAINLTLSQKRNMGKYTLGWLFSLQYQDEYYLSIFNGDGTHPVKDKRSVRLFDRQKASTTVDLGIYIANLQESVKLQAYMNNATNERVATSQLQSPFALDRWYQAPKTIGLSLRLTF